MELKFHHISTLPTWNESTIGHVYFTNNGIYVSESTGFRQCSGGEASGNGSKKNFDIILLENPEVNTLHFLDGHNVYLSEEALQVIRDFNIDSDLLTVNICVRKENGTIDTIYRDYLVNCYVWNDDYVLSISNTGCFEKNIQGLNFIFYIAGNIEDGITSMQGEFYLESVPVIEDNGVIIVDPTNGFCPSYFTPFRSNLIFNNNYYNLTSQDDTHLVYSCVDTSNKCVKTIMWDKDAYQGVYSEGTLGGFPMLDFYIGENPEFDELLSMYPGEDVSWLCLKSDIQDVIKILNDNPSRFILNIYDNINSQYPSKSFIEDVILMGPDISYGFATNTSIYDLESIYGYAVIPYIYVDVSNYVETGKLDDINCAGYYIGLGDPNIQDINDSEGNVRKRVCGANLGIIGSIDVIRNRSIKWDYNYNDGREHTTYYHFQKELNIGSEHAHRFICITEDGYKYIDIDYSGWVINEGEIKFVSIPKEPRLKIYLDMDNPDNSEYKMACKVVPGQEEQIKYIHDYIMNGNLNIYYDAYDFDADSDKYSPVGICFQASFFPREMTGGILSSYGRTIGYFDLYGQYESTIEYLIESVCTIDDDNIYFENITVHITRNIYEIIEVDGTIGISVGSHPFGHFPTYSMIGKQLIYNDNENRKYCLTCVDCNSNYALFTLVENGTTIYAKISSSYDEEKQMYPCIEFGKKPVFVSNDKIDELF